MLYQIAIPEETSLENVDELLPKKKMQCGKTALQISGKRIQYLDHADRDVLSWEFIRSTKRLCETQRTRTKAYSTYESTRGTKMLRNEIFLVGHVDFYIWDLKIINASTILLTDSISTSELVWQHQLINTKSTKKT